MNFQNQLTDLDVLFALCPPLDSFGPGSDYPYLAFDLSREFSISPQVLSRLPCPIIGVGDGTLRAACDVVLESPAKLAVLDSNITKAPLASMILVQHLRSSETLPIAQALIAESFAYATLQRGPEFIAWTAKQAGASSLETPEQILRVEREAQALILTLNDPGNNNAIGVKMRDALCEALELARLDPSIKDITITGAGRSFSTGGAVEEFGDVTDPATAHWIRSLRLPAQRIAETSARLHVNVNGAAIGAGAEIAGFGHKVTASQKAWFQLPELKYGLIPGAGGTVSLPRRIGRQKTAYMALTMEKVSAQKALQWGLVDSVY